MVDGRLAQTGCDEAESGDVYGSRGHSEFVCRYELAIASWSDP